MLNLRILTSLASLCFLLSAGQTAEAQWSQLQGSAAHTGYVPETVTGNRLIKGWDKTFQYNGQTTTHSDIVVSAQGVFTTEYQKQVTINGDSFFYQYAIVSLDKTTGQEKWSNPVTSYGYGGVTAPTIDDQGVYASAFGHSAYGLNSPQAPKFLGDDIQTGQTKFSIPHTGQWDSGSRATALGGQVITLGGYYGGMDSYSAATGGHQWFTSLPYQNDFIPAMDAQRIYIYYGAGSASPGPPTSTLYAINRATGKMDFTIQNPSDEFTTYSSISSVALGGLNDALVISRTGTYGPRQVTAFDLQNHRVQWHHTLNAVNSLAVAGGTVVVPLRDSLVMLNETDGADKWVWNAPTGVSLSSNAVLTDNLAFIASQDTLFGVDRLTGALDWSAFVGADGGSYGNQPYNLAYYGGTLYASGATRLFTFNSVPEPSGGLLCGGTLIFAVGALLRRRARR